MGVMGDPFPIPADILLSGRAFNREGRKGYAKVAKKNRNDAEGGNCDSVSNRCRRSEISVQRAEEGREPGHKACLRKKKNERESIDPSLSRRPAL